MYVITSGTEWTVSATPMERLYGFQVAEEAYDKLNLQEQLMVDLTIEGWTQTDIAKVMLISQPKVSWTMRRIATKLANSQLYRTLDARQHFRDQQYEQSESDPTSRR